MLYSSMADHISYFFGTHGPSMGTDTACSSSLVAMAMAMAALRKGDCDYAIVSSVNLHFKDLELMMQVGVSHGCRRPGSNPPRETPGEHAPNLTPLCAASPFLPPTGRRAVCTV